MRAGFARALPNYSWSFPRDLFAHPTFADEWWYFSGNLQTSAGRRFGFELTLFRSGLRRSRTTAQSIFLAHFALSDPQGRHFDFHERARMAIWGQAGAGRANSSPRQTADMHRACGTLSGVVWNENWIIAFNRRQPCWLSAAWDGHVVRLKFGRDRILYNGRHGWSRKGGRRREASEYYSFPWLPARGRLRLPGMNARVRGVVWMDHEFGTSQLSPRQSGWDWMGLQLHVAAPHVQARPAVRKVPSAAVHLHPGARIAMLLSRMRRRSGRFDPHSFATLRLHLPGAHRTQSLTAGKFRMHPLEWWRSPRTGVRFPVAWSVSVPSAQLKLTVRPLMRNQEVVSPALGIIYWEGAVRVRGTVAGLPLAGLGYLELTGYAAPLRELSR